MEEQMIRDKERSVHLQMHLLTAYEPTTAYKQRHITVTEYVIVICNLLGISSIRLISLM